MATIVVEIPDISGQSTVSGFADKIDALGISERMLVTTAGGARPRSGRTVGKAKHQDIQLVRHADLASPKLKVACSSGQNLGEVKIHLFRTIEQGVVVYFTYTLTETFVSRVDVLTADNTGQAYTEHWSPDAAEWKVARSTAFARVRVTPMFPVPSGTPTNREVEHVWFNAASVRWSYTPYVEGRAGGAIEKAWNIQQGVEA